MHQRENESTCRGFSKFWCKLCRHSLLMFQLLRRDKRLTAWFNTKNFLEPNVVFKHIEIIFTNIYSQLPILIQYWSVIVVIYTNAIHPNSLKQSNAYERLELGSRHGKYENIYTSRVFQFKVYTKNYKL